MGRPGLRERFRRPSRALGSGHLGERIGHPRKWRREVRDLHERQQQSDDPVKMVVREQRDQRQDGNDLVLNLLGAMGHVLGKGMKTQIQDPDQEHDQGEKDDHDIHENVGFTWRRDEKWQMVRCLGMDRRCHRPPPAAGFGGSRWRRGSSASPEA